MKKILLAAISTLCLSGSAFAEEKAGGDNAPDSTIGGIAKDKIVVGTVVGGLFAAHLMNNRGNVVSPIVCEEGEVLNNGVCEPGPTEPCGPGQELVDGVCVDIPTPPVTNTVTATNTITTTNTVTVTNTVTTPVTVTATTTSL